MLYFVDSVRTVSEEGNQIGVVLHNAETDDANEVISLVIPAAYMTIEGGSEVNEGSFVEYDPDTIPENPRNYFLVADGSTMARRHKARFAYYRDRLISSQNENGFELPVYDRSSDIRSFHANVGHGNCSIILAIKGNNYSLLMNDCSIREFSGRNYASNLESCLLEIARIVGVDVKDLKLTCFMLTHPHYDHYNGIEYLIANGLINSSTAVFMNLHYFKPSPTMVRVLKKLSDIGVRVIEPIRQSLTVPTIERPGITVVFPECRIVRSKTYPLPRVTYRVEKSTNNASVVYSIKLAGKSIVFPGDLEKQGFEMMTAKSYCRYPLYGCNYYCVSHHGSLNGHVNNVCNAIDQGYRTVLECIWSKLKYAILMGRDGAYHGIYSSQVINDFNGCLIKTESDTQGNPLKFIEIDWNTDGVVLHQ